MKNQDGQIALVVAAWLLCVMIVLTTLLISKDMQDNIKSKAGSTTESLTGKALSGLYMDNYSGYLDNIVVTLVHSGEIDNTVYETMLATANGYLQDAVTNVSATSVAQIIDEADTDNGDLQEIYHSFLKNKTVTATVQTDNSLAFDLLNPMNTLNFTSGDRIYLEPCEVVASVLVGEKTYQTTYQFCPYATITLESDKIFMSLFFE